MTIRHIYGIAATLMAVIVLSLLSGKKSKEKKGAGSFVVAGAIMGTLVGGSSTVGTAQLAYSYGLSAWWFTLGGGLACLILAVFYVKPFVKSGNKTLMAFITKEYGKPSGIAASVLSSVGSFINIISQLISATAVIAVVFPEISLLPALFVSALFMILYVIFGGTKGSGMLGILKMLLLYTAMTASGIIVLLRSNVSGGFFELIRAIDNPEKIRFFSLFARGIGKDTGALLSLILGVITTQSYAQAVFAANTYKDAKRGALLSAFLIPPIGAGGILVGLFMRATHPGIAAKTALTLFVTENMPPIFGGIVLATLFITVIGTGAGLALGIATVLNKEIISPYILKNKKSISEKALSKMLIIILLFSACAMSSGKLGDTILNFAFMSMGLRGATVFVPLCCAIWLPGSIDKNNVFASIIIGPIIVLIFGIWNILPFDSLFAGVAVSLAIAAAGYCNRKGRIK